MSDVQFQHKIISDPPGDELVDRMNKAGAEGWQLHTFSLREDGGWAVAVMTRAVHIAGAAEPEVEEPQAMKMRG